MEKRKDAGVLTSGAATEPASSLALALSWACVVFAITLGLLIALRWLPQVAWPVLGALCGAYLLDPLVSHLERNRIPRSIGSMIVLSVLLLSVGGVVVAFVPRAVRQIQDAGAFWSHAAPLFMSRLESVLGLDVPDDGAQVVALLGSHLGQLSSILSGAGGVVWVVAGGAVSVLSALFGLVLIPIVGFQLLVGWPSIWTRIALLVPPVQRPQVVEWTREVDSRLSGFVRGLLILIGLLSLLYGIVLTLAGLELGLVVGLVTGLVNLIPYVGVLLGLSLAVAAALIEGGGVAHVIGVAGAFVSVVVIDSLFITPRIVGNRVGLSPAAVILSVLTLGSLFGLGGVLLAVPVVAVLKVATGVVLDAWIRHWTSSDLAPGPASEIETPREPSSSEPTPASIR